MRIAGIIMLYLRKDKNTLHLCLLLLLFRGSLAASSSSSMTIHVPNLLSSVAIVPTILWEVQVVASIEDISGIGLATRVLVVAILASCEIFLKSLRHVFIALSTCTNWITTSGGCSYACCHCPFCLPHRH